MLLSSLLPLWKASLELFWSVGDEFGDKFGEVSSRWGLLLNVEGVTSDLALEVRHFKFALFRALQRNRYLRHEKEVNKMIWCHRIKYTFYLCIILLSVVLTVTFGKTFLIRIAIEWFIERKQASWRSNSRGWFGVQPATALTVVLGSGILKPE